jgi:hypothetical protein
MSQELLYLGLDVHSQSIAIALAEPGGGEVRNYGSISGCLHSLEKTLSKIKKAHPGRKLKVCYEAGPTGFTIARRLAQLKTECLVVAPTLIPNRSGDRVKTDSRDAVKLARLLRAGELRGENRAGELGQISTFNKCLALLMSAASFRSVLSPRGTRRTASKLFIECGDVTPSPCGCKASHNPICSARSKDKRHDDEPFGTRPACGA